MKQEDTRIYFDGHYQGRYPSFPYALNLTVSWLLTLMSFTFLDPITLVIE